MKADKFIRQNRDTWEKLEQLLRKLNYSRFGRLDRYELDTLLPLYNKVCSHLSYSRTFYGNSAPTEYLNKLVSKAHGAIYTTKSSSFKKLLLFYFNEFPRLLYSKKIFFLISFSIFLAGFFASFILTAVSPDNAYAFVPKEFIEGMNLDKSGSQNWNAPFYSSFILTNNIKVGFAALALGITAGVGTSAVLLYNGAMLGGIAALALGKGQFLNFWALILPHGILELFSIFVCGAAGLIIGWSLISPGIYQRKDSLISGSRDAMKLVAGTIPLFVIAGLIEGFVTPAPIPVIYKYAVAGATFVLLFCYLVLCNVKNAGSKS